MDKGSGLIRKKGNHQSLRSLILANKLLTSIIISFLIGMILGIIIGLRFDQVSFDHPLDQSEPNAKFKIVINLFTKNFWYLFLIWFLGLSIIGIFFNYLIIATKGLIQGLNIIILLRAQALFGVYNYFKYELLQILIIIPLTIFISYVSLSLAISHTSKPTLSLNQYLNYIYLVIFILLGYSIIIAII